MCQLLRFWKILVLFALFVCFVILAWKFKTFHALATIARGVNNFESYMKQRNVEVAAQVFALYGGTDVVLKQESRIAFRRVGFELSYCPSQRMRAASLREMREEMLAVAGLADDRIPEKPVRVIARCYKEGKAKDLGEEFFLPEELKDNSATSSSFEIESPSSETTARKK